MKKEIEFDYQCHGCGVIKTNHDIDSFVCDCGGSFHLVDRSIAGHHTVFEPHYNEVIKDYVYSWKDMEEKGRKFRSKDHPNGFVVTQGNGKFVKDLKYIYRHREEYIQQCYAKDGIKYKPGRNLRFDDKTGNFVAGRGTGYQRKYF